MLKQLTLSLQFGKLDAAARHRAALPRHKVARWIRHALDADAEITVRIVDAEEGQALNRDYRQKDYATNVLTFDYSHAPQVHADLVLCAEVVEAEARAQARPLAAHSLSLGAKNSRKRSLLACRSGPAEPEGRYSEITLSLPKRASM